MAANLTTIAITTRKVIKYGILFVIFLTTARIIVGFGISAYQAAVPKPTAAPTARFGPLPPLPFPQPNRELPKLDIKIETATGSLPQLPGQAKVFLIPPQQPNLFSLEKAISRAKALGFTSEPLQLSTSRYRFSADGGLSLELNIITGAFSISSTLGIDLNQISKIPPRPDEASNQARQLLTQADLFPEELAGGEVGFEFLKAEEQSLVRAISLSEANFIRVNLYRSKVDEIGSVTADPNKGIAWFIVGAGDRGKNIYAAEYNFNPTDPQNVETYPLRPVSQAAEELLAGNGYIANLGTNPDGKVTVRTIELAYFDAGEGMQFYQPVYVFRGDRDFTAYVPAVSSEYYGIN